MTGKEILELVKTISNEFKESLAKEIQPLKNDVHDIKKDIEEIKLWRAKSDGVQEGKQGTGKISDRVISYILTGIAIISMIITAYFNIKG